MLQNRTIIAAAERAEAEMHRYNLIGVRPRDWIGEDASFADVVLFDWARLRAEARRSGDAAIEAHAHREVEARS